jgi:hypothetical protein
MRRRHERYFRPLLGPCWAPIPKLRESTRCPLDGSDQMSATTHRVPPPDRRRVLSVVHLGRPVPRGSGGGRNTEVAPLGPVPEEDPDRLPADRAVRLRAVRDAAEGRGPVAGQKCERHRHLLDIEQPQPIKPGSPLSVGVRPELINGQRAFHTKILSTGARVATTDAPPRPGVSQPIRDRSATKSRPSCNRIATERPLSVTTAGGVGRGPTSPRRRPGSRGSRRIRDFSGKLTERAAKRRVFLPGIGHNRARRSTLIDATPDRAGSRTRQRPSQTHN